MWSLSGPSCEPIVSLQVQQSQEKIARLEQEKEHWLLEAQLGKVRLEKENQRIADLEAQLATALGGSQSPKTTAGSTLTKTQEEEAEMPLKAAGKETLLCTSLVRSHTDADFTFVLAEEKFCRWAACVTGCNKGSIMVCTCSSHARRVPA